jgi:hypothetical protein
VKLKTKENHRHRERLSVDLAKTVPSRILPSSPPRWWPGGERSGSASSRSREKPVSFIEPVQEAISSYV